MTDFKDVQQVPFQINQHGMILHFHHGGTPNAWGLEAIYAGSYGIAHCAAETWFERSQRFHEKHSTRRDGVLLSGSTGDFLVQIDSQHVIKRADLFLDPFWIEYPDLVGSCHIQNVGPVKLPKEIMIIAHNALVYKLMHVGAFMTRERMQEVNPQRLAQIDHAKAEFDRYMEEHRRVVGNN